MKRVIVTGASGFVGQHLCKVLRREGAQVVEIDRRHGFNVLDSEAIRIKIEQTRPDVVYHLAGFSSVGRSWDQPAACFALNVEGVRNVMEACRRAFHQGPILIVSSSEVYGQATRIPTVETTVRAPLNPYGESRVAQEDVVHEYEELRWIITRSYGHTGPGQGLTYAYPSFARRLLDVKEGKTDAIIQVGHVDQWRDISDVRDTVEKYFLLTERAPAHTVVNVCSGRAYLVRHVIEMMAEIVGVEVEIQINKELKRPNDTDVQVGSKRFQDSLIGDFDRRDLAETLQDVVHFVRNESS